MENRDAVNAFHAAAQDLVRLQEQVQKYRSAVEVLEAAAGSFRQSGQELQKLVPVVERQNELAAVIEQRQIAAEAALREQTRALQTHGSLLKFFAIALATLGLALFGAAWYVTDKHAAQLKEHIDSTVATMQSAVARKDTLFLPAPKITTARLQALNGCGINRVAESVHNFLEDAGYRVYNTGDADHFKYRYTQINARDTSAVGTANVLAEKLGVMPQRIFISDKWPDYDVTIVLGNDYATLIPNRLKRSRR